MDETEFTRPEEFSDCIGSLVLGYPLNGWWVAAASSEVCEKPLARTILETRLALFRTGDGKPHAFADRCPHRSAPLSLGKLVQDEIVCAYHGFRYNLNGECTVVPTLSHPPRALRVRTYPALELGPFVWVWMGDPSRADPALLPIITWRPKPNELRITGYRVTNCDFSLIQENISDLEHSIYLHGECFGYSHRIRSRVHGTMDVKDREIKFRSVMRMMPPSKLDLAFLELEGNEEVNQSTSAVFTGPGCFSAEIEMTRSIRKPGALNQIKAFYLWCSTPISASSCHFWWNLAFDPAVNNRKMMEDIWARAIQEDIEILEGIQNSAYSGSAHHGSTDVLVAADRAVAAIRRLLKSMVKNNSAC